MPDRNPAQEILDDAAQAQADAGMEPMHCPSCGSQSLAFTKIAADWKAAVREVQRLREALQWIAEYGTRDGDLLEGHEDAMRMIALNSIRPPATATRHEVTDA